MTDVPYTLGYIQDEKDERDYQYSSLFNAPEKENYLDLREHMSPIRDQGTRGACVAFATCAVKEYQEMKQHGFSGAYRKGRYDLSEEFIYQQVAQKGGGSFIRDAMKIINHQGVAREAHMPYDNRGRDFDAPYKIDDDWRRKYRRALGDARKARTANYAVIGGIMEAKQSLLTNGPLVIGMRWHNAWFNPRNNIIRQQRDRNWMGGHAFVICGFDDSKKQFIIRNSWGTDWGEDGYGYMDYDVVSYADARMWTMYDRENPYLK